MKIFSFSVLVVPANREELVDLIGLVKSLGIKEIHLLSFGLALDCINKENLSGLEIHAIHGGSAMGIGAKAFVLLKAMNKLRPALICVGAQLLYQRLAFIFKGRARLLVYNRGLLGDLSKSAKLSLRILQTLPRTLRSISLFNPYVADYSLVINSSNKAMLARYGVNNCYCVGLFSAIWRTGGDPVGYESPSKMNCLVVLATQAYSSHGLHQSNVRQIELVKSIHQRLALAGVSIVVRKHPRDTTNYVDLVEGVLVDDSPLELFLFRCRRLSEHGERCILISPPSTLLIEWVLSGLGGIVCSDDRTNWLYSEVIRMLPLNNKLGEDLEFLRSILVEEGIDFGELDSTNIDTIYCDSDFVRLKKAMLSDGCL